MKLKVVYLASLFLVLMTGSVYASSSKISTDIANVHISDTSVQIIDQLKKGTAINVLDSNGRLLKISYGDNSIGWIDVSCTKDKFNTTLPIEWIDMSTKEPVKESASESKKELSKEPVIETCYTNEQAEFGNEKHVSFGVISNTLYIDGNPQINSLIYTPFNTDEPLPLVVYVHGIGECGNDINVLAEANGLPKYLIGEYMYPNAIIVMPQSKDQYMFHYTHDSGNALRCLINKMVETYNVDRNRISIVGYSMGVHTASQMVSYYPDTFASAVLVAGSYGVNTENLASKLEQIPVVRGYCGSLDPNNTCKYTINDIYKIGGNAEFFEVPGASHLTILNKVFFDYDILEWMINQSK